jgi:hypothetical protein
MSLFFATRTPIIPENGIAFEVGGETISPTPAAVQGAANTDDPLALPGRIQVFAVNFCR